MTRELWHLALADIIDATFEIGHAALRVFWAFQAVGLSSSSRLDFTCQVVTLNGVGFMTSVLIEMHIAAAFLASTYRNMCLLKLLDRCLVLVWPAGFILGICVETGQWYWDPELGICNYRSTLGEDIKVTVVLVATGFCTVAYVCSCFQTRNSGGAVQERALRRASLFPLMAVVAWLPLVFYYVVGPGWTQHSARFDMIWETIAFTLLECNGLLNAIVYAVQTGFSRRTRRQSPLVSHLNSFHVAFDINVSVCEVPATVRTEECTAPSMPV